MYANAPILQGSEHLPDADGGRVVVTTWLLASLVFMSSYSGILTAMITVPRVTVPIDSVEDLVDQRDIPWRIEAGSMMFQYFQVSLGGRWWFYDYHKRLHSVLCFLLVDIRLPREEQRKQCSTTVLVSSMTAGRTDKPSPTESLLPSATTSP